MSSSPFTPRWGHGGGFSLELLTDRPGLIIFKATGKQAEKAFRNEAGGHRWQRIPPTEKRGRVHTSTITVAVLPVPEKTKVTLPPGDLRYTTCRGSGPGGQHRNKVESAVQLTHIPTGISVRCENEKSQHRNRELALELLQAHLWEAERAKVANTRAANRRQQVGTGMRGDKRRTIRSQDGIVTDHILNKKWKLKDYLRGNWS